MAETTTLFHEVFRSDGTPYREAETSSVRRLSTAPKQVVSFNANDR
jgi:hypothetical protein